MVQIYESLLKGEELAKNNPTFWDELFLIKPKLWHLETELTRLTPEQLTIAKENINALFIQCIESLSHEKHIRIVIAMQTLCVLVHSIYKKTSSEPGFDVISLLMGVQNAEEKMQKLLNHCQFFLAGEYPDSLKGLCLKLLLVFVTGTENVNQNTLIEYIMMAPLFESLIQLLCEATQRQTHGHDVVLLLTLLVNYRKHESANPYIVKLSIIDDELALNGYGQVITASLTEFCKQFVNQQAETQNSSWLSTLSTFTTRVGSMFISEEEGMRNQKIKANNALLLALYEAIHLNRNFITTLAQMQTDTSSPPSPSNTLNSGPTPDLSSVPVIDVNAQPSNLLVTFFQYCSIVMQDTKTDSGTNTVKLCFIILSCIAEDQYANSLMHDVSLTFKVQLHRMPMRHQKPNTKAPSPQPLVAILLDLLVEFIVSHKMKKLPLELYMLAIGIIHRLLVYQKRCRVRINYKWIDLWESLTSLIKYLIQNESTLTKKMNIFDLCLRIVNILNFFITYGDTFLPTPGSYDELYYELIRNSDIFTNLDAMCLRYETMDNEFKENAQKLNNSLINIRAISKHFEPKIKEWLASQHLSTPSEEQILDVVKANYGSLLLKLHDSLEQYERYSENPNHLNFFTAMVTSVVCNSKLDSSTIDTDAILEELTAPVL